MKTNLFSCFGFKSVSNILVDSQRTGPAEPNGGEALQLLQTPQQPPQTPGAHTHPRNAQTMPSLCREVPGGELQLESLCSEW